MPHVPRVNKALLASPTKGNKQQQDDDEDNDRSSQPSTDPADNDAAKSSSVSDYDYDGDDVENDNQQDGEDDNADDDEEEGEEEEEEEADDDEEEEEEESSELGIDPFHITVQLAGSDACKVLHFRNETTWPEFRSAIATALNLPEKSKFIVSRKRKGKTPQTVTKRSQFDSMVDDYFAGDEQFIRILVTPEGGAAADANNNNNNTLNASSTAKSINNKSLVGANASVASAMGAAASPPGSPQAKAGQQQQQQQSMMSPIGSGDFVGGARSAGQMPQRPSSSYSRESNEADAVIKAAFESGEPIEWKEMRTLGTGAFGKVVEAITGTGHIVAVKHMIFPANSHSNSSGGETDAETMVEEIRLMKNLRHRHIVGYYGCQSKPMATEGGRVVDVFMEACHGGSLSALRKKYDKATGRLPVRLVRAYIRQVLEGLAYLHLKQVVHRDIKADNVLIDGRGVAKLADFGCSKKLGGHSFEDTLQLELREMESTNNSCNGTTKSDGSPDTIAKPHPVGGSMAKTLVGTPLFIAPEVLTESAEGYLSSADIWSVGCLVIELFGKKPWNLNNTSVFSVMFAIAQSKSMPTGMPDEADPKMLDFLTRCFNRDPSLRPTARQLLEHPWITCPDNELVEPIWKADLMASSTNGGASGVAASSSSSTTGGGAGSSSMTSPK